MGACPSQRRITRLPPPQTASRQQRRAAAHLFYPRAAGAARQQWPPLDSSCWGRQCGTPLKGRALPSGGVSTARRSAELAWCVSPCTTKRGLRYSVETTTCTPT
eukprot:scaffold7233_cov570-Prasinococcus_capsulatus_cf.AAC.1